MREVISQYGGVIGALIGGTIGIALAVSSCYLLEPVIGQVLSNLM